MTNSNDLTTLARGVLRRRLLGAGIPSAHMGDDEIRAAVAALDALPDSPLNLGKSVPESVPEPEPEPEPESVPESGANAAAAAAIIAALEAIRAQPGALDEARVIQLIAEHGIAPRTLTVHVQQGDKAAIIDGAHSQIPELLAWVAAGKSIALFGPPGSGKTTAAQQVAKALDLEYRFTSTCLQEHKVLGFIDATGTYHRTPFRDAFEFGGIHVCEEFDSWGPKVGACLNNALAGAWCDFPDGMVEKHASFICIANMNTSGRGATSGLVARNSLDGATLDRFAFLEWAYDENLERECALAVNPAADSWVTIVQQIRAIVAEIKAPIFVTPRASIEGAGAMAHGLSVAQCKNALIYKGISADQIAVIETMLENAE